jgi:4-amino-4-deoxy-L-arabinose transferase-like glycosyltransferase
MSLNLKEIIDVFRKRYASSILFWIILFFILRLFNITSAPIEIAHNWRQAFTNTVARNFFDIDNNIFFPKAVIFGNNSGIVGTEFPLLNYIIYIFAKMFGYDHWYGRLINLIVSSIGIYYFYKIVFKFLKSTIAFNATIVLICSLWFVFSRKSMPDTFSISIVFIGLYFGLNFLYEKGAKNLILFIVFTSIGILCKIPGLFFLCVFVFPFFDSRVELKTRILFVLGTCIVLVPVLLWYFRWVPYLDSIEGNRLYFPRTLKEGILEVVSNIGLTAEKFYFSSLQSYVAFFMFLAGLFFMFKSRNKKIILTFALLTFVFFIFILKTGIVFPLHSYYVIPYTPIMCVLVAYALDQIQNKRLFGFVFILIIAESIANQQNDFFIKKDQLYKLELESIADKVSDRNDLIAINGGESPQLIYFAHRNGWRATEGELSNADFINSIRSKGCKYIFLDKHILKNPGLNSSLKTLYNDENFIIYSLITN